MPTGLRQPNTLRRRGLIRLLVCLLALGLGAVGASAPAHAWSARKTDPPKKPGKPKSTAKPKSAPTQAPVPAAAPTLQVRVDALLARKPNVPGAEALKLLREAVTERQMALAVAVAEAMAASAKTSLSILTEAATVLGQDYPVQRKLWQRAWQAGKGDRLLGRVIAEGWSDALLASGDATEARKVLEFALSRADRGARKSLFERLVALARLQGDLTTLVEQLRGWNDPDAVVLASGLLEEDGDDDGAVEELRRAVKQFPAHRGLQAALIDLLGRLGRREELQAAVAQVVRQTPGDPMPWLVVLDAHIAVRDVEAARNLIDELARKHPRNDVLLEALIDREQRLDDDPTRVERLYEALLAAAPEEAQYVEAYAEWLLGRADEAKALQVLGRLAKLKGGEFEGLQRQASLLLAQNRLAAARAAALRMQQLKPDDPRAVRLLALLDEREGRLPDAERRWLGLATLSDKATPGDRARAAEARQALAALLRRAKTLGPRTAQLRAQVREGKNDLGMALLLVELEGQLDGDVPPADAATWAALTAQLLQAFPGDAELLTALAQLSLQRNELEQALPILDRLGALDPDAARPLLAGIVESALAQGRQQVAATAEGILTAEGLSTGVRADGPTLLRLGEVHLRYGDTAHAAALFRRAAAADPRDTRATARLAALFRIAGDSQEEETALREIVFRARDADELETAGQRLLTLALAAGRSAELVRWLDTIQPQHTQGEAIERFRLAAYDAWMRNAALDRQFGSTGPDPVPSPVGNALASGDLPMQVRALRQIAFLGRPVPAATARQLLRSPNPILRRDTALALGASGTEAAARLLVEVLNEGQENDEDVSRAQVVALARLPAVPGAEPLLVSLLSRGEGGLAALSLGRTGGLTALPELIRAVLTGLRVNQPAAILGLGALLGRHRQRVEVNGATALLFDQVLVEALRGRNVLRDAALLWALAATGHPDAHRELLQVAVLHDQRGMRRLAARLAAASQPPVLPASPEVPSYPAMLLEARDRQVRAVLGPWLTSTPDDLRPALVTLDAELGQAARDSVLRTGGPERLADWCATWTEAWPAGGAVDQLCRGSAAATN